VQTPIVLTTESHSAIHHLALPAVAKLHRHLGADRAAIAARPHQLELDPALPPRPPLPAGVLTPCPPLPSGEGERVLIEQHPSLFIRDDDVEPAAIEEVGHRDAAAIEPIRDARFLPHIDEPRLAPNEQQPRAPV